MTGFTKKYLDLYHRLRALSDIDPADADACWLWKGLKRGRAGNYPRINVRLEGVHRQLAAHRVALVAQEILEAGGDWALFWPLYHLYSAAGFEADHECNHSSCVNADHLCWREKDEHLELTLSRRAAARGAA